MKFKGSHIPGSPFQVRVGEPGQGGGAGLVTAYGAGLERGTTGDFLHHDAKTEVCIFDFLFNLAFKEEVKLLHFSNENKMI